MEDHWVKGDGFQDAIETAGGVDRVHEDNGSTRVAREQVDERGVLEIKVTLLSFESSTHLLHQTATIDARLHETSSCTHLPRQINDFVLVLPETR